MRQLIQNSPLGVVILMNIQEIEYTVERVAQVGVHSETFLNFVKVDDGVGCLEEGKHFVVEWLVR